MRILDDAEMDAQLSRTLVAIAAEAADIGEALATARRVPEGDYDSWYTEWSNTANTASAVGDDAALRGHKVTARKAYLRASEYWRQAFFSYGTTSPTSDYSAPGARTGSPSARPSRTSIGSRSQQRYLSTACA